MGLMLKKTNDPGDMFGVRATKLGLGVAMGVVAAGSLAVAGFNAFNEKKLGTVSYAQGPDRMTKPFGTGAPQAMMRLSGGNYNHFSAMASGVIHNGAGSRLAREIDDYGADAKMISALYNMGV